MRSHWVPWDVSLHAMGSHGTFHGMPWNPMGCFTAYQCYCRFLRVECVNSLTFVHFCSNVFEAPVDEFFSTHGSQASKPGGVIRIYVLRCVGLFFFLLLLFDKRTLIFAFLPSHEFGTNPGKVVNETCGETLALSLSLELHIIHSTSLQTISASFCFRHNTVGCVARACVDFFVRVFFFFFLQRGVINGFFLAIGRRD